MMTLKCNIKLGPAGDRASFLFFNLYAKFFLYVEFVYKLIPSYQIMICFGITIDILGVRNQMSFYLYFESAAM